MGVGMAYENCCTSVSFKYSAAVPPAHVIVTFKVIPLPNTVSSVPAGTT